MYKSAAELRLDDVIVRVPGYSDAKEGFGDSSNKFSEYDALNLYPVVRSLRYVSTSQIEIKVAMVDWDRAHIRPFKLAQMPALFTAVFSPLDVFTLG